MAATREWLEKDFYKVLGVSETSTEKEIKAAYRKLSKQYHPDNNPGNKEAEEKFKDVSSAYEVLGDPAKKQEYDEVRKLGPSKFGGGMPGGGFGGFGAPNGNFSNFETADLGDLLGGLFGRQSTRRGPAGPQRGEDLEAELHLSFRDALAGVTTSVNLTSSVACNTCHGTGAAPGSTPVICSQCGGRGVTDSNQGLFSFSQTCRGCSGTGMRVEKPCPTCNGTGNSRRPRQVKVRVPAGVSDGQRIKLKNRGGAGHNGGPAGDLYVVVRVAADDTFGRKGNDLTITVPITFPEAALGASVTVPTMSKPVTLKIPPGTKSGRTFRAKGHGVASGSTVGDLLVTVEVVVPAELTDAQRAAVEAFASASTDSPRTYLGV